MTGRGSSTISTFAALLLVAAFAYGCSGGGEKASIQAEKKTGEPAARYSVAAADLGTGKDVYDKYCRYCHGKKGYGDGAVGIALTPHPADFVNDSKRMAKSDEELYKSISSGVHRDIGGESMQMPRWQEILSDKERWDVLAYIRLLEREGKAEAAAAKGDRVR